VNIEMPGGRTAVASAFVNGHDRFALHQRTQFD